MDKDQIQEKLGKIHKQYLSNVEATVRKLFKEEIIPFMRKKNLRFCERASSMFSNNWYLFSKDYRIIDSQFILNEASFNTELKDIFIILNTRIPGTNRNIGDFYNKNYNYSREEHDATLCK